MTGFQSLPVVWLFQAAISDWVDLSHLLVTYCTFKIRYPTKWDYNEISPFKIIVKKWRLKTFYSYDLSFIQKIVWNVH